MIDLETGRELLDFAKRIEPHRADEQLRGAIAIHNILAQHRVAYLADEVGMGKTYVALGALALFRHYQPSFRVLVIAPRDNIQQKWQDELTKFSQNNVRFDDMRMRALGERPPRPMVSCTNLLHLVREVTVNPNRDFFVRMPSFSLQVGKEEADLATMRDGLRKMLPWLRPDAFDLRNKDAFKKNVARAICAALPTFDLVIVDEAHNLKHGFSEHGSARNRVLAEVFGRHAPEDVPNERDFPGYGPRARRVLFLSATPLEESYRHVWNQLDLFGLSKGFEDLRDDEVSDERKKAVAARFLVRRVTSMKVAGASLTKNLYRREWRAGGVSVHDEPTKIEDVKQRLVVALVQKKVSELLAGKKFNRRFQMGMLASFESFLETAKLKTDDPSPFDDPDQSDISSERDGIDVHEVNRLAKSYRSRFGKEMPHPKMDALVESLATSWTTGKKALVFVRRVSSVSELKRKLDERYDAWLVPYVRERLPEAARAAFDAAVRIYQAEKGGPKSVAMPAVPEGAEHPDGDAGGNDTFFAWFFRGEGPKGFVSGATIAKRFHGAGSFSTVFEVNHVMHVLEVYEPGNVLAALSNATGLEPAERTRRIRDGAAKYLSAHAKIITRASRFAAAQASALELLAALASSPDVRARAKLLVAWKFAAALTKAKDEAPADVERALEEPTLFSELCRPGREELRAALWPPSRAETVEGRIREEGLRTELMSSASRLGHPFVDLYLVAIRTVATASEDGSGVEGSSDTDGHRFIRELLDTLEHARVSDRSRWGAFDELRAIASNLELIVDTNLPDSRNKTLAAGSQEAAGLLRQQRPVAGMAGQVNQTVVRQFRMPGYPFVLITTDVLQEGEDLHTFCSEVHHYGISWTPSAMEQRIGRIDRVRSQTDRRLASLEKAPSGAEKLQVYFPHLQDTIEVLQVERVLDRMNTFLRLMHEGFALPTTDQRRIDVSQEILRSRRRDPATDRPLQSSFPVREELLRGKRELAVAPEHVAGLRRRFESLPAKLRECGDRQIDWADVPPAGALLGTIALANGRTQPFTLLLRSDEGRAVVRCVSPVGRTDPGDDPDEIAEVASRLSSRVGAILTARRPPAASEGKRVRPSEVQYDLTVEDDVLLAAEDFDRERVGLLVDKVTREADDLERQRFVDGEDHPLDAFERDLRKEAADD